MRQPVLDGIAHATAGDERAAAARGGARAVSKDLVIAALARDTSFGYERVQRVILELMRADAGSRPVPGSGSVLRALLAECADAQSARALAPVEVPATVAGAYDEAVARVRALAESASDEYFRLDNDSFNKDLAACLGQLYPSGARLIDLNAVLPCRVLLLQPMPTMSQVRFLWQAGRCSRWFRTHLDTRDLSEFNEPGFVRSYLRIATLLEANPHVGGVYGESWYFDPCLEILSPHLAYLRRLPCDFGARLFRGRTSALTTRRALLKSTRRRQAFDSGSYRPRTYLLVWPRREIIRWAHAESPEGGERARECPTGREGEVGRRAASGSP